MEALCPSNPQTHDYWTNKSDYVDSIFTGKVFQKELIYHASPMSSCILAVKVDKWFKGRKINKINVNVIFANDTKNKKKNACSFFKKKEAYIFYGRNIELLQPNNNASGFKRYIYTQELILEEEKESFIVLLLSQF
jgi:hypothetical protein